MILLIKAALWLVFIIGLVILIHEIGHFAAAKLVGIKVEEFALGFGKKIWGKKVGETLYKINIIPYGGYVKLLGEEKESKDPRSFSKKSFWAKAFVIVGGVVMNFLLAVVTFNVILAFNNYEYLFPRAVDYGFLGCDVEILNKPYVAEILEGTPADEADFPVNSIIWELDGNEIKSIEEFQSYLYDHQGEEINMKLLVDTGRGGEWREIKVTPRETDQEGVLLGVKFDAGVASYYELNYSRNKILSGTFHSINYTGYQLRFLGELIKISFEEKTAAPVAENVRGVVGLADMTVEVVKVGNIWDILSLLAGVNLSIALMNILPIPALDGGYLFVMVIEKITKRKVPESIQNWVVRISFAILILIVILITIKDIIQFDIFERIISFAKNLF